MRAASAVILMSSIVGLTSCDSSESGPAAAASGGAPPNGTAVTDGGRPPAADGGGDAAVDLGPIGGDRPVSVHVPPGYVPGVPAPLVILLHGYSASGDLQEAYFQLTAQSDARGFLYAHPDGTPDASKNRFWNATDACCNFEPPFVDDSKYLNDLIDQIAARFSVDPKRIFFVGHSNGGFMSYRMACDHPERIAAIVSLAGAMVQDLSKCPTTTPVNVLEIHGTADAVIAYGGGANEGHAYPGAQTTIDDWVAKDGCTTTADTSPAALDLDSMLPGAETTVKRYASGCKPGGSAELWTLQGGGHIPALTDAFAAKVVDFLYAHPKP